nr:TonB-dependent receptor [uncultured Dyadobacter sp.]
MKTLLKLALLILAIPLMLQAQVKSVLERRVTLSLDQVSLGDALHALGDQAQCTFSYSGTYLDVNRRVSLQVKDMMVKDVLTQLIGEAADRVRVQGSKVLILAKTEARGNVKGIVKTSDGQPAEFVNVAVRRTGKGAQTDVAGEFMIRNIPAGKHTVVVQLLGYAGIEQEVDVVADQTTTLQEVSLLEDSKTLQELVVTGNSNKFANKESDYVARMPLKNLENPQVYSVVGKALMNEQMITRLEESFRNVPGATVTRTGAGMPAFISRGFQSGDNLRNGMATFLKTGIDPAIVDRVEVIRGPSSTLFGSAMVSFNGLVNYITKKPFEKLGGEVSYSTGSNDLSRLTLDVNTPVNKDKTLLFRFNAAAQKENSFQDQGYSHTTAIAPSFTYKASDRLTLNLNADIQTAKATSATLLTIGNAVKAKGFDALKINYKRSLIDNSANSIQASNNVYFQAEYRLSDQWTSQTNYAWSLGTYDHFNQFNYTWMSDSTIRRQVSVWFPDKWGRKQIQQNFIGDFNVGPVRNRLLVGLDYLSQYRHMHYGVVTLDTVNINKASKSLDIAQIQSLFSKLNAPESISRQYTYSAYASDMINFSKQLMVMLSLRVDRFENKGTLNSLTGITAGAYGQTAYSPKLGIIYQPLPDRLSVFANYMNGFKNIAVVTQPDGTTSNFKPQQANQWEAGVKLNLLGNKLNATVSYYDISVKNSTYLRTINNQNFTVQDGTQQSKGIEVELIANPVSGLNIVIGYGHNDNEFTRAAEAVMGKRAVSTPKHTGNAWISYQVMTGGLMGLGLGAGGYYVSESYFNAANNFIIPSYTLVNATVFYDQPRYRISLKGDNLLNEKYWLSDGSPQKPANVMAGVALKF